MKRKMIKGRAQTWYRSFSGHGAANALLNPCFIIAGSIITPEDSHHKREYSDRQILIILTENLTER